MKTPNGPTLAEAKTNENVRARDIRVVNPTDKYMVYFECPFCTKKIELKIGIMNSQGKRCLCGALFSCYKAYHFKDALMENKEELANDKQVTLREAEQLMEAAFKNVIQHFHAAYKELIYESNVEGNKVKLAKKNELTPQQKDEHKRNSYVFLGRAEGMILAAEVLQSAADMITKEEVEEEKPSLILPNYLRK